MDTKKNNQSLLIGVTGIVIQVIGFPVSAVAADVLSLPPELTTLAGLGLALVGTAILIWGMCLYAQAKEQSGWWGLMGILGIIGLIVLSALPDRHDQRQRAQKINADITQPPEADSVEVTCFDCGYMLNGVMSGACPECGRGFDPMDLRTVLVHDALLVAKPPWTARWSMICGVLGCLTFCIPFLGFIFPAIGIAFGHMAIIQIKKLPKHIGPGVAIAGLILSYLTCISNLLFSLWIILDEFGVL